MLTVSIRRYNQAPYDAVVARARTNRPAEAIARVGTRHLGFLRGLGACEHFPGGSTYRVQFVTGRTDTGVALSDTYIAQVEEG